MKLTELTITEAAELIKARKVSPVELTEAHLARIERVDPRLNCFITLTAERALDSAREAEETIGQGSYLGPLHGIPIMIKGNIDTADRMKAALSPKSLLPRQEPAAWSSSVTSSSTRRSIARN